MVKEFLAGKVAVITGASRGLGAAAAALLAEAGAETVLVSRTESGVRIAGETLARAGRSATPIAADIASAEAVTALFDSCLDRFGRVDILVNIAGIIDGIGRRTWEVGVDEWRALAETNITGPFLLCRAAVPIMQRNGAGRILLLTSSAADRPTPRAGPYGASKAAVNQLVRAMAEELVDTGITVNAFNPGPVKSATLDRVRDSLDAGPWRRYWAGATRSPEEAARLVLWLCSPGAAELNGEVVFWNDPSTRAAMARFEQGLDAD